jgi:hypothetical protein
MQSSSSSSSSESSQKVTASQVLTWMRSLNKTSLCVLLDVLVGRKRVNGRATKRLKIDDASDELYSLSELKSSSKVADIKKALEAFVAIPTHLNDLMSSYHTICDEIDMKEQLERDLKHDKALARFLSDETHKESGQALERVLKRHDTCTARLGRMDCIQYVDTRTVLPLEIQSCSALVTAHDLPQMPVLGNLVCVKRYDNRDDLTTIDVEFVCKRHHNKEFYHTNISTLRRPFHRDARMVNSAGPVWCELRMFKHVELLRDRYERDSAYELRVAKRRSKYQKAEIAVRGNVWISFLMPSPRSSVDKFLLKSPIMDRNLLVLIDMFAFL